MMQHITKNAQEKASFDYEILPSQKRTFVQQKAVEIKEHLRHTARTIWEIGEKLVHVRSQLGSGQFIFWLKLEFGWSLRTAYNFINVYKAFPELANFAKIDISISVLYLLAAPSTPQEIRSHFLNRAIVGEPITYKAIQKAIQAAKLERAYNDKLTTTTPKSDLDLHSDLQNPPPENTVRVKPQTRNIVYPRSDLYCKYESTIKSLDLDTLKAETVPAYGATTATSSEIRPGWNLIKKEFLLFWGDTASPRFIERLPQDAFVLAVPSSQWHHDWLFSKSRNLIILHQPVQGEELIEKLLSVFSHRERTVILPWLPSWQTIALALKLDIKIYAGDPDLKQCEKLISKLGLKAATVSL
jgi:hypothetical protein